MDADVPADAEVPSAADVAAPVDRSEAFQLIWTMGAHARMVDVVAALSVAAVAAE